MVHILHLFCRCRKNLEAYVGWSKWYYKASTQTVWKAAAWWLDWLSNTLYAGITPFLQPAKVCVLASGRPLDVVPFFPGINVFWHNYNFSLLLTLEWNSCQRLRTKDVIVIWGLWEPEGFVYPHFSLRYRLIFNKYGGKHWLWKDIVILKHSRKTFSSQKSKVWKSTYWCENLTIQNDQLLRCWRLGFLIW